jgi:hypothetical protein
LTNANIFAEYFATTLKITTLTPNFKIF